MSDDLITQLLPVLGRASGTGASLEVGFNVFDVMHHGTHEKQLSNVFAWILDIGGTHDFEGLGQKLFVELINGELLDQRSSVDPLSDGPYSVRQEVNTSGAGRTMDIADIVLDGGTTTIVVENYVTSDGHGHSYPGYLAFGRRGGKKSVVILLCHEEDRSLLSDGWENSVVVTYERFLDRLLARLDQTRGYAEAKAEQFAFLGQMHRKFANGKGSMSDKDVLDFIAAMCVTGEANRYQQKNLEVVAEQFASDVAQQARERFVAGRETLQKVKARLRMYGRTALGSQLTEAFGTEVIRTVSTSYQGIYEWTINFDLTESFGDARVQIKFGPSAWKSNENDPEFTVKVDPEKADYSRLFVTRHLDPEGKKEVHEIRQSEVSLAEVLEGLAPDDTRLRDELIALLK